jgi:thiamine-phosphate pyrophosphorylase
VVAHVSAAARAGLDLVQIRERDLSARSLLALVERVLDVVSGTRVRVVVNDRLDVAIAAGAHGVHLRGDSIDAARVREVAPADFLVGRSVHDEREAVSAAGPGNLDYLVLGSIFPTSSKSTGHPTVGIVALARVARAVDVPVVAIGGITRDALPAVIHAGAAGVAAIRLFESCQSDLGAATREARLACDAVFAALRGGRLSAGSP